MNAARARTHTVVTARRVAGVLLYRRSARDVEVLLLRDGTQVHPGRNKGVWTMPRTVHVKSDDARLAAADAFRREADRELQLDALESLGSTRLRGDRLMAAWACVGPSDPDPAIDGRRDDGAAAAPVDGRRLEWFPLDEACRRIKPRQRVFVDRLRSLLPAQPGGKKHSRPHGSRTVRSGEPATASPAEQ